MICPVIITEVQIVTLKGPPMPESAEMHLPSLMVEVCGGKNEEAQMEC